MQLSIGRTSYQTAKNVRSLHNKVGGLRSTACTEMVLNIHLLVETNFLLCTLGNRTAVFVCFRNHFSFTQVEWFSGLVENKEDFFLKVVKVEQKTQCTEWESFHHFSWPIQVHYVQSYMVLNFLQPLEKNRYYRYYIRCIGVSCYSLRRFLSPPKLETKVM